MTGVLGVAFSSAAGNHIIPHIMNIVRTVDAAHVLISSQHMIQAKRIPLFGFIGKFKATVDYNNYTMAQ